MSLFQPESLGLADLPHALALLPPSDCGIEAAAALKLWQHWHNAGALYAGWVRALDSEPKQAIKAMVVTLWITDHAVACIKHGGVGSATQQLY